MSFKEANSTNFNLALRELLRDIGRGTFRKGLSNNIKIRNRKNYPIYSLVRRGYDIVMRYRRVKVEEFYKHLNINVTNRIVGFTPDFVGASRSQIVKARNYVKEFISDNLDFICNETSESCKNDLISSINSPRVVYSAGYDTCTSHLREYFKDNTTEKSLNRDDIIAIIAKSNFKWFKAPVCEFSHGRELFDYVRVNYDSYPGHYSAKLFGNKKGYGDTISRNVAYKLWTKLKDKPIKNLYLWKILGREKDIKLSHTGEKEVEVGTRVVITCESPITYLLMWMSQKLNYVLGYTNWDSSFNLCGEFNAIKSYKLTNYALDYDYCLEADWSFYDSNIDTHFLEVGAALLTNGITPSKLHDNMIVTFIMSVVTKYVIIPPGIVAELNRSQPSGHPAGSLINCYVNILYWCIIGYKIYGDNYADNMRVEVYGDDTRAYFKDHPNLIKIDQYIKECGLQSDKILPNIRSTKFKCDKDKDIDFLKRRFDETTFAWNHKKMFDKWLYQSRNRDLNDQVQMVLSYLSSVPTDKDLIKIVSKFINWVTTKHSSELSRDSLKVIDSINQLVNDEVGRIDSFKFHLANRYNISGYYDQINLLSFSTFRPREILIDEKYLINNSLAKHVLLYVLGIDVDELRDIKIKQFLGVNRSPPYSVLSPEQQIVRTETLFRRELDSSLRRISSSIFR